VSDLIAELNALVGPAHVRTDPVEVGRSLRDNSWLSPILTAHFGDQPRGAFVDHGVDAVVSPADDHQVQAVLGLAVEHRVPVTPRGAGTSNFGQAQPTAGGIVLDTRRLRGVTDLRDGRVTAGAGTLQGDVEAAALATGQELTVLTTTYASATIAGWVAGGHVGLGASMYGTIWDGNVLGACIATATSPVEVRRLDASSVVPVLHTFGTTGVILDVTMPLVPARRWGEWVVTFADFAAASRFTEAVATEGLANRVAAAQEPAIMPCFRALRPLALDERDAAVLLIADEDERPQLEALVAGTGGHLHRWRDAGADDRPSLMAMVYGHRMLWVKKLLPTAAFLHTYFRPDDHIAQVAALKERFGDRVLLELKYMASPWLARIYGRPVDRPLPAGLIAVVDGSREEIDRVATACDELGIRYQNPHTYVLEESGLFPDPAAIVAFARDVDPYGLLNPGKLGARAAEQTPRSR
jgi:FAD/FMN-containing dehydrogenase